jgi:hypothetical protein
MQGGSQATESRCWLRDEEVVGSNPATPTVEQQVRGPSEKSEGPSRVKVAKSPSRHSAISYERDWIATH